MFSSIKKEEKLVLRQTISAKHKHAPSCTRYSLSIEHICKFLVLFKFSTNNNTNGMFSSIFCCCCFHHLNTSTICFTSAAIFFHFFVLLTLPYFSFMQSESTFPCIFIKTHNFPENPFPNQRFQLKESQLIINNIRENIALHNLISFMLRICEIMISFP